MLNVYLFYDCFHNSCRHKIDVKSEICNTLKKLVLEMLSNCFLPAFRLLLNCLLFLITRGLTLLNRCSIKLPQKNAHKNTSA